MNVTELARRLRVRPEELLDKLPELGFSVGKRAIKVDDRVANQIMRAWGEMRRKDRLQLKMDEQKALTEKQKLRGTQELDKEVTLPSIVTVRDFASRMNLPVPRVMQELMQNGIMAAINERIDFDTASIVAEDLGFKAIMEDGEQVEDKKGVGRLAEIIETDTTDKTLENRPPVIVVMGHVDHGKTKLLDAIRSTNVADSESGGITQHIGAYQVERKKELLTFIDTPGHEAFTVMRSRGAKVADIAILVVAADDGVQPQTKEAINIIKSSGLPFIVALNKIDREEASIDRVKGELSEFKLVPEDWGGDTVMVPISAKENIGIDDLLDHILLLNDMWKDKIRANPNRPAIGTIIESHVDPGEGPVATVLVQSGTLHIGDVLGVKGTLYGKARAMRDWKGDDVKEVLPSTPVKVVGFKNAPAIGDILEVPKSAKSLNKMKAKPMRAEEEVASIQQTQTVSAEEGGEEKKKLNVIIRADMLGSLEAVLGMLDKIHHPLVGVDVVSKGLGNITDSDILNAEGANAVVYGFNVKPAGTSEELAREKEVELEQYTVIYKLFEDVLERLEKLLPSEKVIEELGKFEVLANFKKLDNGWVIGGKVLDGKLIPKIKLRILRAGEIIAEGDLVSLQIGHNQAKKVHAGQECGMQYKGKTKVEIGDILEAYKEDEIGRKLEIEGVSLR